MLPAPVTDESTLRRQLLTLGSTIEALFSLDSPSAILDRKLSQIESIIMEIPESYEQLTATWRTQLANWWKRYDQALDGTVPNTALFGALHYGRRLQIGQRTHQTMDALMALQSAQQGMFAQSTALSPIGHPTMAGNGPCYSSGNAAFGVFALNPPPVRSPFECTSPTVGVFDSPVPTTNTGVPYNIWQPLEQPPPTPQLSFPMRARTPVSSPYRPASLPSSHVHVTKHWLQTPRQREKEQLEASRENSSSPSDGSCCFNPLAIHAQPHRLIPFNMYAASSSTTTTISSSASSLSLASTESQEVGGQGELQTEDEPETEEGEPIVNGQAETETASASGNSYDLSFPTLEEALSKVKTVCPEPKPAHLTGLATTRTAPPTPQRTVIPLALTDTSALRAHLLSELSSLPTVTSPDDMESVKILLRASIKVFAMLAPVRYDKSLQEEVFTLLFQRIPGEKQRYYDANYAHRTVNLLSGFLRNEIVTYYAEARRQVASETIAEAQLQANQQSALSSEQVIIPVGQAAPADRASIYDAAYEKYCRYCKRGGHTVPECEALKATLCFNCYEYGHTAKRCPEAHREKREGGGPGWPHPRN